MFDLEDPRDIKDPKNSEGCFVLVSEGPEDLKDTKDINDPKTQTGAL